MIDSPLALLWWLVVAHFVGDFWAQSDALAKMKNRHRAWQPPPGQVFQAVWPYALTAHAVMHGAAVAFVTGVPWLGLSETAAHWMIDFGKCENWYGIHADQALHLGCKIAWLALWMAFA